MVKRGRKPRGDQAANKFVGFWVTEGELEKLQTMADANHQGVGPLCRDICLEEVEESLESPATNLLIGKSGMSLS